MWDGGIWERAAPGAMAWWVEGGPRTADCLRGFVRVGAGNEFPHHKHLGEEKVLVIQGHARLSDGGRLSAGDFTIGEDGAEHSFAVIPGGPDLLVFTVIHRGLDFGAFQARPRD
ncbi:MAG: cupin domain-containing protein [Myxococcota bacterium]